MKYDSILARSFSRYEQKKFRYGALFGCLLVILSFCTVFKPYFGPLQVLNLRVSMGAGLKMLMVKDTRSSNKIIRDTSSSKYIHENISHNSRHVVDEITNITSQHIVKNASSSRNIVGDVSKSLPLVDGISNSSQQTVKNITNSSHQLVKDNDNLQHIAKVPEFVPKEVVLEPVCNFTIRSDFCETNHDILIDGSSASVFIPSSTHQTGISSQNSSWIIRPYARKGDEAAMNSFNGEVQFLITDNGYWWIEKFRKLLKKLSRYDIIDIDKETDVHCFPRGIIGLKRYDGRELTIDPSKSSQSMKDFRELLRSSYSLPRATAIKIKDGEKKKPRLLIIARKRTRSFTNAGKIAQMARRLGYKVIVAEATMNVQKFAELVNSCDVLLGVHGAGLTNIVFLPENAVVIQVVPLAKEWLSRFYFEEPSMAMNLSYLEYKVRAEESSLIQQYPLDHQVLKDPSSIRKQGWEAFKSVYLDKQNIQLDLKRFRGTLLKARELLAR
ncbi:alpha-1,3-arabinosyltransferase XAT2-like isoform X2 [Pistacia vera]|uniref:alpha-1,3-arabinosyltransferase XAT2-like isoform X2 n=1 Tax=Pistacia vera TaxID=55513 RepID=UPI0012636A1F|nr:alpha-1,3-arabinosyltransferase XAT2-like isoform X2 [Pistacia vera]